jgi:alpha-beta hydrolase superfamily lysophospholipase
MTASESFSSPADDLRIATHAWTEVETPRGVVQVAHGLAEHAQRYERFARALNDAGYLAYATDHRGHGQSITDTPGDFGEPGFPGLSADVAAYGGSLGERHPDLPLFLFGHSMGSFAAQHVILEHADRYAGVVLSGSTALDVLAAGMAQSEEPAGLEAFNAGFEHRTGYEWLSRDEAEVDAYVADPLCGFDLPEATVPALFDGADRLADPEVLAGIRSDLAILIASGEADPLAGGGQLVQVLGQRYREAGLSDVTVTVYPGARHEILNETNRDDVTAEVIRWLDAHA